MVLGLSKKAIVDEFASWWGTLAAPFVRGVGIIYNLPCFWIFNLLKR